MKILFWGTYDTGKPRLRILLRGLKENGVEIIECHFNLWGNINDKSQIKGMANKLHYLIRLLISYPTLLIHFIKLKKTDAIFIGYMGQLDVIIIYPFAKFFRIPIIWDPFISLYDTIVEDRKILSKENIFAKTIHLFEKLSCFSADLIVLDTDVHAQYFENEYRLDKNKVCSTFVGVEPDFFYKKHSLSLKNSVLFYGQFIPLHGIDTIIEAAEILKNEDIHFTIIGTGQEANRIDRKIERLQLDHVTRINWVDYPNLLNEINNASLCLGVFGNSSKASRVIPNKVFQILATGKPLITMDSPAIRELIDHDFKKIKLIKGNDPIVLSNAIKEVLADENEAYNHLLLLKEFTPKAIGRKLIRHINERLFT